MDICIQNTEIVRKKERNLDEFILSIRLRGADVVRFWEVMDLAKSREPYVERTEIIRELLGLDSARYLTPDEIKYFQTGEKALDAQQETASGIPHGGTVLAASDEYIQNIIDTHKGKKRQNRKK